MKKIEKVKLKELNLSEQFYCSGGFKGIVGFEMSGMFKRVMDTYRGLADGWNNGGIK